MNRKAPKRGDLVSLHRRFGLGPNVFALVAETWGTSVRLLFDENYADPFNWCDRYGNYWLPRHYLL